MEGHRATLIATIIMVSVTGKLQKPYMDRTIKGSLNHTNG